jgi:hypothetical protein
MAIMGATGGGETDGMAKGGTGILFQGLYGKSDMRGFGNGSDNCFDGSNATEVRLLMYRPSRPRASSSDVV